MGKKQYTKLFYNIPLSMCICNEIIPVKFRSKYLFQLCPQWFFICKLVKNLEAILNWKMNGGASFF